MIVIYGWRTMGRVDEVERQYALTKFFHVFWLPIVPFGSVWIVDDSSGGGHAIKLYGKSVFAAYARWWGLIIGTLCLLGAARSEGGAIVGLGVLALVLLGMAGWGFSSRTMRDETARKLSAANQTAFKTRCEPRLMTDGLANELHGATGRMWAEVAGGKTPSDIARFGASDKRQATLAYAQLRLSALKLQGIAAREAEQDALRIIESVRELPAAEPYRSPPVTVAAKKVKPGPEPFRSVVAPDTAIDQVAARIVEQIAAALEGEKFTRRDPPKVGLNIDLVMRRDGLMKSVVVVVLRAPNSYGGLGMATPPIARSITDHVGGGTVVIVYVGLGLGSRIERLETGLFDDEIAVRGIFAVDAADNQVTTAMQGTTQPIVDKVGQAIARAVAKAA